MEPAMMPASKYFWKKGYITSSGRLEIIMVAYLSSSAILARSAVLWISAIMPDSGWLWIRMEPVSYTHLDVYKRQVDLIANPEVKDTFVKRSQILKEIRAYLDETMRIRDRHCTALLSPFSSPAPPFLLTKARLAIIIM